MGEYYSYPFLPLNTTQKSAILPERRDVTDVDKASRVGQVWNQSGGGG